MKAVCSILLTFFMVFRPLIPVVDYAANYNHISQNLCENRLKPELYCNGKCYLANELAKTGDTNTSPLHKGKNAVEKIIDIDIPAEITEIVGLKTDLFSRNNFTFSTDYSFLFSKNIFRPPLFKFISFSNHQPTLLRTK